MLFLLGSQGALLADEMGLGKTVQALVAASVVLRRGRRRRVLIVVPKSLRLNWLREAAVWAAGWPVKVVSGNQANRLAAYALPTPILIATYDQIAIDWKIIMNLGEEFDLVILDEAQRIKNASSRAAWTCRLLPRQISWALTGTPVENRVDDIRSIYRFVKPGLLTGAEQRTELHNRIRPHFLRRQKSEVLADIPPIQTQDLHLLLGGEQAAAYRALWQSRHEVVRPGEDPSVAELTALFSLITKLKQLCNYDPVSGESAKLEALRLILEGVWDAHQKVLVFSQYVRTLRWLRKQLREFTLSLYTGEQTEGDRDQVLDNFRASPDSCGLLISIRAGGVGLNLQEASTVVLFDRWWNPAVEEQAVHRAHRFGRTQPLYFTRFLVDHSIEERIAQILEEKQDLFQRYVEEAGNAAVFGREELLTVLK